MTSKEALRKEYQRERNRISRFMRAAEKRGYIFEEGLLPSPPKRITKASVRRLSKLKPDFLYSHAHYVDPDTGEYMPAKRGRVEERKKATRKAHLTTVIKKDKGASLARGKRQEPPETTATDIPYYPSADYLSYQGLMVLLDSAAVAHANARIMKWYISDYLSRRGQGGMIDLVRAFSTPQGEEAIREASEIAYDSDGERARQWWFKFEKILVEVGVITEEEMKDLQDARDLDEWANQVSREERRAVEEERKARRRGERQLERFEEAQTKAENRAFAIVKHYQKRGNNEE